MEKKTELENLELDSFHVKSEIVQKMNYLIEESDFKIQTDFRDYDQSKNKIKELNKMNKQLHVKIEKSRNEIMSCLKNLEKINSSNRDMQNHLIRKYFKSFLVNLKNCLKILDSHKDFVISEDFEIQNNFNYSNFNSNNFSSQKIFNKNEEIEESKSFKKESNIAIQDNSEISFESIMKDYDKCKREDRKDNLRYFRNVHKINKQNFLKSEKKNNLKKYKKWEEQLLSKNI